MHACEHTPFNGGLLKPQLIQRCMFVNKQYLTRNTEQYNLDKDASLSTNNM